MMQLDKKTLLGIAGIIAVAVAAYVIFGLNRKDGFEGEELEVKEEIKEEAEQDFQLAEISQDLAPIVEDKPQLQADELLPQYDEANEFAKQNPISNLLKEQNFLISGYHMGINTVMQSNKIPYHDLRSAPPIPKENISPFLQSSYEAPAGAGRKQFELM